MKTFIRTDSDLAAIARYKPFTASQRQTAGALCVAFVAEPLTAGARKQGESTFSNLRFEKALNVRATFRGVNTVAKLAARYGAK